MNKFKTSWLIFRQTLEVMKTHKALLFFPVVISGFTLVIALFFVAPIALQPTGYSYLQGQHWKTVETRVFTEDTVQAIAAHKPGERHGQLHFKNGILAYLLIAYFISMFLAAFFNTAFCSQIISALRGGEVSIAAGIQFAQARWKAILFWSMLSGLVGLVIRKLEERVGFVGRIVIGIIGMAWSVASVFAIPVLVENASITNPLDVLRDSAGAIKKTWGETIIGYAGMQFANMLIMFGSLGIFAVGGGCAYVFKSAWPLLGAGVLWLAAIIAISYVSQVAAQIYQCALYLYASTGTVPGQFDRGMMDAAWKSKS
jgi:hypothetical protein